MKIRLAMMASFSVILLAGALLWLMDTKVSEERNAALEKELRGSVMSLTQALQSDLKGLRRGLSGSNSLQRIDWNTYQPFFALAQVRFGAAQPEVLQFSAKDGSRAADWKSEDLQKMLLGFAKNSVPNQNASLGVLGVDPQRPLLALFWRDGEKTWLALTGPEFLQAFLDLQKDSQSVYAVMNAKGEILAHSTAEYVGTKISQGSLYAEVQSSPDARAYREYTHGAEGPALAAFEKVPRTDVTILAFRSVKEIQTARMKTLLFGALASFGLLLLTVSGVWWIAGGSSAAQKKTPAVGMPLSVPTPVMPVASPQVLAAKSSLAVASSSDVPLRIASAIGHELRGPLMAILGYCQMILASSNEQRVTEPTDSILRETRAARSILDKLLAYAGEKETEKKPLRLEALLYKVLKDEQPRFQRKHVKVTQEIRETSELPMAESDLEKAIRHLLDNAVEAMDRMTKKEITIRLIEEPDTVRIEIQDTGEGIEDERKEKIMDPFFTTRGSQSHLGLGLPAALGIVRENGGELKIESKRGQGTKVVMLFAKPGRQVQIANQTVNLTMEAKVEIPKDIPVASSGSSLKGLTPPPQEPLILSDLSQSGVKEDETENSSAEDSSAPADLDLDQLFSMPEATVKPAEPEKTMVLPPSSSEDRTMMVQVDTSMLQPGDEKITRPQFETPKRDSRLDEVKVAIRRPGTRLE
ncbi:MAG: GHKL domain-containing protein [Bdellovibrionaceae bacterium]|nr:GHKL domain-containing protein [Pseudobdellovibrionaceae bacterium]